MKKRNRMDIYWEKVLLFLHPEIIKMEVKVIRLEKCRTNKERDWSKDHLCV